ncbi:MAG TPA: hypothetical protein VHB21_01870 [Minicystis sp.]|nr:hypothetical protein [Minicystis sp.]
MPVGVPEAHFESGKSIQVHTSSGAVIDAALEPPPPAALEPPPPAPRFAPVEALVVPAPPVPVESEALDPQPRSAPTRRRDPARTICGGTPGPARR